MKNKPIKTLSDVKSGTYLRCTINCYGIFWTDRVTVVGKPYKENTNIGREWVLSTRRPHDRYFLSDFFNYGDSRTFKFSSRLETRLSKASDVFDFIFMLTGKSYGLEDRMRISNSWEFGRELDRYNY